MRSELCPDGCTGRIWLRWSVWRCPHSIYVHEPPAVCMQLSAVQQRADQAARELQEAHIARMAAENRVAELQMRQSTASSSTSQQVLILLLHNSTYAPNEESCPTPYGQALHFLHDFDSASVHLTSRLLLKGL